MNKKFKIQFAGSVFIFALALSFAGIISAESKEASPAAPMAPSPPVAVQTAVPIASKIKTIESDTNKDGKPDRWEYYGEDGILNKIEADTNGDGKADEWGTVENGKIIKVAKDTDLDGRPDKWVTYY